MIHFPSKWEVAGIVMAIMVLGWVSIEGATWLLDWLFEHIEWK